MFNNIDIVITTNTYKRELLETLSNQLLNIKIYTLGEFNKKYYCDYSIETVLYVMKKYNLIYEIAKIYLNNLTYIEDTKYNNEKLDFLSNLKKDLINNNYLKDNRLFKAYLSNKNILLYNLDNSKEVDLLKQELKRTSTIKEINNIENKYNNHQIFELPTIEDEVVFIASDICKKIKEGIDIRNIYLVNLNDEYYKLIRRIFPMFNIPFTLNDNSSIYGTYLVNKFLELYSNNIEETLDNLKEYVDSEETENIYNKIISIVNKYSFINNYNEVLPLIKEDLKQTKLDKKDIIYSVHESNLDNTYNENDYVYLLSFNQGIIPKIYKDELYLSDKEKEILNISLTVDKNTQEKKNIINYLSNIKNLIITYKKLANGSEYNISNINEELNYEVIKNNNIDYSYSNIYNKIKLTSLKDNYEKYGTKSSDLHKLSATYKDLPYNTYDNKFKGIDNNKLHMLLNNKLSLSYTKVDNYYKCPFSYYISYILKLNIYEDTFFIKIGNLFHAILERFNSYSGTYDELWQEEINNLETEFNNQETFFLEKLKDELQFVINTIKEQENYTELHDELHEQNIYTSISGNMTISFSGKIDKIKYKKEDNRTIIAIIDYKTGSVDTSLTTIPYGIGMQLPIYLYLAKNSDKLEHIEVAGFYLQHVLNNEITVEKNKSYEEEKKKSLLLQGYSNSNIEILSTFDKSFDKSNIIKSMSLTKSNDFSKNAKILTSDEMNYLTKLAEENISSAADKISNGEFSISPKKIGDTNYGCRFCKFKDICYYTNNDIVELKELSKEEVFGGDNNGMD